MKQLTEDEFDKQFTVIPDDQGETIRPTADGIDTSQNTFGPSLTRKAPYTPSPAGIS